MLGHCPWKSPSFASVKGCPQSLCTHGFSRVPFASTSYTTKMNHLHKSFKTTDALAHRYDIRSLRIENSAKQESFQQDCKGFQTGKCVFNDG